VKGSFGLSRRAFRLLAGALLVCGVAAADTIIAGGIDTTRDEYNVWIKQDGANSSTYFADAIEIEFGNNTGTGNRGALSVDLFTDISLSTANETGGPVVSEISSVSTATVLERITPTLPLNDGALTAAQVGGPQVAGLGQHRSRRQRSGQSD